LTPSKATGAEAAPLEALAGTAQAEVVSAQLLASSLPHGTTRTPRFTSFQKGSLGGLLIVSKKRQMIEVLLSMITASGENDEGNVLEDTRVADQVRAVHAAGADCCMAHRVLVLASSRKACVYVDSHIGWYGNSISQLGCTALGICGQRRYDMRRWRQL